MDYHLAIKQMNTDTGNGMDESQNIELSHIKTRSKSVNPSI
jgi:hypothetical protein